MRNLVHKIINKVDIRPQRRWSGIEEGVKSTSRAFSYSSRSIVTGQEREKIDNVNNMIVVAFVRM